MPYRSFTTLQAWVAEFTAARGCGDLFKVIPQDGSDGADTGLIVIPIHGETTTAYLEPSTDGASRWCIQFEPRSRPAVMSGAEVRAMASQLQLAAELCDYIEQKSVEHMAALA